MSTRPEPKALLVDESEGWLTIRLNRPEARNALSPEVVADMRATLATVRANRSVRGITIRGNGGVFCAGGDLKGFKSNYQSGQQSIDEVAASSRAGGEMFDQINEMPQVVVMLVEGAAVAGG